MISLFPLFIQVLFCLITRYQRMFWDEESITLSRRTLYQHSGFFSMWVSKWAAHRGKWYSLWRYEKY